MQKQQKYGLYKALELDHKCTIEDIKNSYRKLVIKVHPDKNKDDPDARTKFTKITEAYKVLSDPEKKKIYDETGKIQIIKKLLWGIGFHGDNIETMEFETAYNYFRQIYKKVELEDIEDFSKKYRHGTMEEEDLLNFYKDLKGDMTLLLEHIPLSTNEDVPRFIQFFQKKIEEGEIPKKRLFSTTKNDVKKLKLESKKAKKALQKIEKGKKSQKQEAGGNSMSDLVAMIQNKNKVGFLEHLEKKYAKQPPPESQEEEAVEKPKTRKRTAKRQ